MVEQELPFSVWRLCPIAVKAWHASGATKQRAATQHDRTKGQGKITICLINTLVSSGNRKIAAAAVSADFAFYTRGERPGGREASQVGAAKDCMNSNATVDRHVNVQSMERPH